MSSAVAILFVSFAFALFYVWYTKTSYFTDTCIHVEDLKACNLSDKMCPPDIYKGTEATYCRIQGTIQSSKCRIKKVTEIYNRCRETCPDCPPAVSADEVDAEYQKLADACSAYPGPMEGELQCKSNAWNRTYLELNVKLVEQLKKCNPNCPGYGPPKQ